MTCALAGVECGGRMPLHFYADLVDSTFVENMVVVSSPSFPLVGVSALLKAIHRKNIKTLSFSVTNKEFSTGEKWHFKRC